MIRRPPDPVQPDEEAAIAVLLHEGWTVRRIARALRRAEHTIAHRCGRRTLPYAWAVKLYCDGAPCRQIGVSGSILYAALKRAGVPLRSSSQEAT